MMGLAFEGEGPHKAADYFARLPLYPTTVQEFDQIHFTNSNSKNLLFVIIQLG